MRTLVIWGAGRIGRGFVADLFHAADWRIVFVDIDAALVRALNEGGGYTLFKARADGMKAECLEGGFRAVHTSETGALSALFEEEGLLLDIAVHEPKLHEVADRLAPLIAHRADVGAGAMDIMMNVNMMHPDAAFASLMTQRLSGSALCFFQERVGVTGIAAMCISPVARADMLATDPLAVLNNGFPEQAIDRRSLKGEAPRLPGIRLSEDVSAEETRKLYTLNMAHAFLCYLGTKKGYSSVLEAASDAGLRAQLVCALEEASLGLTFTYGFPAEDMTRWRELILSLLDNPYIDDDLVRLGADSRRKLSRFDRLCGPAHLCLQAGGTPTAIARAIRAGFDYRHDDPGTNYVRACVQKGTLAGALGEICALEPGDKLFGLIMDNN